MAPGSVVVYKSRTGFTEKYAKWIAEDLTADLFEISGVDILKLAKYNTIIYGGNLHATGIDGVKIIKENLSNFTGKKIIVFACGASYASEEIRKEIADYNFTQDQQKRIEFFYLQGGFNFKKLPPFDKILMTLFKWRIVLRKMLKKNLAPDEGFMLSAFKSPVDFTKRSSTDKITACARL